MLDTKEPPLRTENFLLWAAGIAACWLHGLTPEVSVGPPKPVPGKLDCPLENISRRMSPNAVHAARGERQTHTLVVLGHRFR